MVIMAIKMSMLASLKIYGNIINTKNIPLYLLCLQFSLCKSAIINFHSDLKQNNVHLKRNELIYLYVITYN